MEHIRPTHASMHVRLYSMLTFAFANIISYFFSYPLFTFLLSFRNYPIYIFTQRC